MPVVNGEAKWASIQQPNTTFEPVWSIDVVVDVETAKKLKAEGLPVKKDKDGDIILKCKKKVYRKDQTKNQSPRVVDGNKEPLLDLVGNGSKVNVQYQPYEWNYAGNSGIGAGLVAVQVLELVPFGGAGDEFEKVGDTVVVGGDEPSSGQEAGDSSVDDFDDDIPF